MIVLFSWVALFSARARNRQRIRAIRFQLPHRPRAARTRESSRLWCDRRIAIWPYLRRR